MARAEGEGRYAIALAERQLRSPTSWRGLLLAAVSTLLVHLHPSGFVVALAAAGVLALTRVILRRAPELPDSTTIPVLDFNSPESFAPVGAASNAALSTRCGKRLEEFGYLLPS